MKTSGRHRSERPAWFARVRFHDVRISEQEYPAWRYAVLENWDVDPEARGLWAEFEAAQGPVLSRLDALDWPALSSWELVKLLDGYVSVLTGVATFLPRGIDRPYEARRFLFMRNLVLLGIDAYAANRIDHPLVPGLQASLFLMAGPHVDVEIERREAQHLGAYAARLMLLAEALRSAPEDAAVWERERERVIATLPERVGRRDRTEDLLGRAYIGAHDATNAKDPLEVLARSLDGEFDAIIARDQIDAARKETRRRNIEILVRDPRDKERPHATATPPRLGRPPVDRREPLLDPSPEDVARLAEYVDRVEKRNPKLGRVLAAMVAGATRREAARAERVTDRTVRNWRKGLKRP